MSSSICGIQSGHATGVAETILKQNHELSRSLSLAFSESFKQNDIFVNQMKNLTKESSLFGLGVSSSLKIFDEPIMLNIAEVLKDIQQNPEKYKEVVEEVSGKNNIYSYKVIADYLTLKIPELFTTEKILFFLLSMAVQNAIGEFIKEQIVAPNICIARSGCRIRESGTIQSEIQVVVPSGEEVLVMEDRGRWKKVFWTKDTGEVFEGWIYSSLMEWKFKKEAKDHLAKVLQ